MWQLPLLITGVLEEKLKGDEEALFFKLRAALRNFARARQRQISFPSFNSTAISNRAMCIFGDAWTHAGESVCIKSFCSRFEERRSLITPHPPLPWPYSARAEGDGGGLMFWPMKLSY